MSPQISRFSSFFISSSLTGKNAGIYSVLTRPHAKKHDVFETIFHHFSAPAPPFKKRQFFTLVLPPVIRAQERC